jgi:hypothetical protein
MARSGATAARCRLRVGAWRRRRSRHFSTVANIFSCYGLHVRTVGIGEGRKHFVAARAMNEIRWLQVSYACRTIARSVSRAFG